MRRILVTGANKGIGLAIVTAILSEHDDTFVFLGSRDRERGEAARRSLVEQQPAWADRFAVVALDVTSDASVNAATLTIRQRYSAEAAPLYGLVNNAGVGGSAGLSAAFDTNTLGMRRVCEACVPLLDPTHGRVVNITSAAGPSFVANCSPEQQRFLTDPSVDWPKLEGFINDCLSIEGDAHAFAARGLADGNAYGLSKACANAYTLSLARRFPSLHVNACTPGFIETDMTRSYATSQGKTPAELGMRSPAEGTRSTMYLLYGELAGNGRYYGSDAQRSPLDQYRSPGSEPYRD